MRKLILWLFVLLILVFGVNALEITLVSPEQNANFDTLTQDFLCTSSESGFMTFKTRSPGFGWISGSTESVNGGLPTTFSYTYSLPGTYEWTCNATSSTNQTNEAAFRTLIISVNNPPVITPDIPNQNKSLGTESWVLDLDSYKSDEDTSTCIWSVSGIDASILNITISDDIATFYRITSSVTNDIITFTLTDSEGLNDTQDITVYFYETSSTPPPTFSCDGATVTWDKDDDKTVDLDDYCDPDAISYEILGDEPENISVSLSGDEVDFDPDSGWTGTQTIEFNATKDDLSDTFTLTLKVEEPSSSSSDDDSDDTTSTSEDIFIIKSYSPSSGKVNLKIGDSKTFKVTPSGETTVRWYLDEEKVGDGNSYTFKPSKEGTYELVAVIGSTPSLKKNDDFYMWTVTVGEEDILASNICGNDKVDEGENCDNCPRDVKCAEGERCRKGECVVSTGFFSRVSGYAVDTKDFVVKKWEYGSVIGGIIVVLVIFGILYARKRKKEDVLYAFGREGFFSKIGKVFKGKKKKGYVTKKVEKPTVEKQREVYVDRNPFTDDKKL